MKVISLVVAAVLLAAVFTSSAWAEKTPVKPSQEISGANENADLAKDAPKFIANEKDLEKLWKAWDRKDKPPKVDFMKNLVVLTTTRGSSVRLVVTLDEKGNLEVGGFGTRDLRPGFRYVIGVVPREGVKTVGGKELP
jgi:hypothetical protein